MAGERKIFQVSEITRQIRQVLEGSFGQVWIEGEISNLRRPASGHYYFTLKDATAQIAAVLFRGSQRELRFEPRDGMLVRAQGNISVYERDGRYQILIRQMEEGGKGALQARFEALKETLRLEGLFEESRKRSLPLLPQHVGIVTSPTGAAIRDILNVIGRRFPNLHVVLAPVKVQGPGAAAEIAAAIDLLNARGGLDVMIVGRGGGSLEDLWCFNEEAVARAISRSRLPVISAVGHEIDFTIADFVADVRAATPSAAAELVVGRKEEFEERVAGLRVALSRGLRERVLTLRNRLLAARASPVLREPAEVVRQQMQRVDSLSLRMQHAMTEAVAEGQSRLRDLNLRRVHRLRIAQQRCTQDVRRLDAQIRALSPLAVLERGYSVTTDAQRKVITDVRQLKAGDRLRTRLAAGTIESTVVRTERDAP
ncbi:MAG: exodeoxyribonuclease VII large subunit [Lentisphaerae bacterium]|nr:exodeoxyribonuclease VII large subunit [Lentisphaerota bacterium]